MIKSVLLLYVVFALSWFKPAINAGDYQWQPTISKSFKKKIDKQIVKLWKVKDAQFELIPKQHLFYKLQENDTLLGYLAIKTANGCTVAGCSGEQKDTSINQADDAEYEDFTYMVLYNKQHVVEKVSILEYNSTHGFEICSSAWLKQFKGYHGGSLKVGKNVDGISGATISANSLTLDLELTHDLLKEAISN